MSSFVGTQKHTHTHIAKSCLQMYLRDWGLYILIILQEKYKNLPWILNFTQSQLLGSKYSYIDFIQQKHSKLAKIFDLF